MVHGRLEMVVRQHVHVPRTGTELHIPCRDDIGINPPWFMFHFGKFLCGCFQWLLDTFTPAAFRVNDIIMGGYIASHVLLTLTELGVPDALGNGPLTIDELSRAVGMPFRPDPSRNKPCYVPIHPCKCLLISLFFYVGLRKQMF